MTSFSELLRLPAGPVRLSDYPTDAEPGVDLDQSSGEKALAKLGPRLLELQTKLLANRDAADPRSLLLVLQGMDTSGKGGSLKHTIGLMDPVGLRITSFKAPTELERAHDFLWRIEKAVQPHGFVGVFDRSHYEDVLIGRVRSLAPPEEIERRYGAINDFEKRLVDDGTIVVKAMLHISAAEQKKRLLDRLNDPHKYWKYNPGDVDERQLWADYQRAYEIALERCNTPQAPWYLIPSDKKWYRNLAIAHLLKEALESLDLDWPAPAFDLDVEKRRLAEDTIS